MPTDDDYAAPAISTPPPGATISLRSSVQLLAVGILIAGLAWGLLT